MLYFLLKLHNAGVQRAASPRRGGSRGGGAPLGEKIIIPSPASTDTKDKGPKNLAFPLQVYLVGVAGSTV